MSYTEQVKDRHAQMQNRFDEASEVSFSPRFNFRQDLMLIIDMHSYVQLLPVLFQESDQKESLTKLLILCHTEAETGHLGIL